MDHESLYGLHYNGMLPHATLRMTSTVDSTTRPPCGLSHTEASETFCTNGEVIVSFVTYALRVLRSRRRYERLKTAFEGGGKLSNMIPRINCVLQYHKEFAPKSLAVSRETLNGVVFVAGFLLDFCLSSLTAKEDGAPACPVCCLLSIITCTLQLLPSTLHELFPPHTYHHRTILQSMYRQGNRALCCDCHVSWSTCCRQLIASCTQNIHTVSFLVGHDVFAHLVESAEEHKDGGSRITIDGLPLSLCLLQHVVDALCAARSFEQVVRYYECCGELSVKVRDTLLSLVEHNLIRTPEALRALCRVLLVHCCLTKQGLGVPQDQFVSNVLDHVLPECAVPHGNVQVKSQLELSLDLNVNFRELNTLVLLLLRCVPRSHNANEDGGPSDDNGTETIEELQIRVSLKRHLLVTVLSTTNMFADDLLANPQYFAAIRPFSVALDSFHCDQDMTMQAQVVYGCIDFLRVYVSSRGMKKYSDDTHVNISDLLVNVFRNNFYCLPVSPRDDETLIESSTRKCLEWNCESLAQSMRLLLSCLQPVFPVCDNTAKPSGLDGLLVQTGQSLVSVICRILHSSVHIAHHDLVNAALNLLHSVLRRTRTMHGCILQNEMIQATLKSVMLFVGPVRMPDGTPRRLPYIERTLDIFRTVAIALEAQHSEILEFLLSLVRGNNIPLISSEKYHDAIVMASLADAPAPVQQPSLRGLHCHHWMHEVHPEESAPPPLPNISTEDEWRVLHLCAQCYMTHSMTEMSSWMPKNRPSLCRTYKWLMDALRAAQRLASQQLVVVSMADLESYESDCFGTRITSILQKPDVFAKPENGSLVLLNLAMDCVFVLLSLLSVSFDGCPSNVAEFEAIGGFDTLNDLLRSFPMWNPIVGTTVFKAYLLIAFESAKIPTLEDGTSPHFQTCLRHPVSPTMNDSVQNYSLVHPDVVRELFLCCVANAQSTDPNMDALECSLLHYIRMLCGRSLNAEALSRIGLLPDLVEWFAATHEKRRPLSVGRTNDLRPLYMEADNNHDDKIETALKRNRKLQDEFIHAHLDAVGAIIEALGAYSVDAVSLRRLFSLAVSTPSLQERVFKIFAFWSRHQTVQPMNFVRFPYMAAPCTPERNKLRSYANASSLFLKWDPSKGYTMTAWFRLHKLPVPISSRNVSLVSLVGKQQRLVIDITLSASHHIGIVIKAQSPDGIHNFTVTHDLPDYEFQSGRWQFLSLHHRWSIGSVSNGYTVNETLELRMNGTLHNVVDYSFQSKVPKQLHRSFAHPNVYDVVVGDTAAGQQGPYVAALDLGAVNLFSGELSVLEVHVMNMLGGDLAGDFSDVVVHRGHMEVMQYVACLMRPHDMTEWYNAFMQSLMGCSNDVDTGDGPLASTVSTLASRLLFSMECFNGLHLGCKRRSRLAATSAATVAAPKQKHSSHRLSTPRNSHIDPHDSITSTLWDDGHDSDHVCNTPHRTPRRRQRGCSMTPDDGALLLPLYDEEDPSAAPEGPANFDVSRQKMDVHGNAFLARRSPFSTALDTVGGLPSLLWLLSHAESTSARVLAVDTVRHCIAFNPLLLRRAYFDDTYSSLAWFLRQPRIASAASLPLLNSVLSLATSSAFGDSFDTDEIMCNIHAAKVLLLDMSVWKEAPTEIQKKLISLLLDFVTHHPMAGFHREVLHSCRAVESLLMHMHDSRQDTKLIGECTWDREVQQVLVDFLFAMCCDLDHGRIHLGAVLQYLTGSHKGLDIDHGQLPHIYARGWANAFEGTWRRDLAGLVHRVLSSVPCEVLDRCFDEFDLVALCGLLEDPDPVLRQNILKSLTVLLRMPMLRPLVNKVKVYSTLLQHYRVLKTHLVSLHTQDTAVNIRNIIDNFDASIFELDTMLRWAVTPPSGDGVGSAQLLLLIHRNAEVIVTHYIQMSRGDEEKVQNLVAYFEYLQHHLASSQHVTSEEPDTLTFARTTSNPLCAVGSVNDDALVCLFQFVTMPVRNPDNCTSKLKRCLLLNYLTAVFIEGTPGTRLSFATRQVHRILLEGLQAHVAGNDIMYVNIALRLLEELAAYHIVSLSSRENESSSSNVDTDFLHTFIHNVAQSRFSSSDRRIMCERVFGAVVCCLETKLRDPKVNVKSLVEPLTQFLNHVATFYALLDPMYECAAPLTPLGDARRVLSGQGSSPEENQLNLSLEGTSSYVLDRAAAREPARVSIETALYDAHRKLSPDGGENAEYNVQCAHVNHTMIFTLNVCDSLLSQLHAREAPGGQIIAATRRDEITAVATVYHRLLLIALRSPHSVVVTYTLLKLQQGDDAPTKLRDPSVYLPDVVNASWTPTHLVKDSPVAELSRVDVTLMELFSRLFSLMERGCVVAPNCVNAVLIQRVIGQAVAHKLSRFKRNCRPEVWKEMMAKTGVLYELLDQPISPTVRSNVNQLFIASVLNTVTQAHERLLQDLAKDVLTKHDQCVKQSVAATTSSHGSAFNMQKVDSRHIDNIFVDHATAAVRMHEANIDLHARALSATTRRVAQLVRRRVHLQPLLGDAAAIRSRWSHIPSNHWRAAQWTGPDFMRGFQERYFHVPMYQVLGFDVHHDGSAASVDLFANLDSSLSPSDPVNPRRGNVDEFKLLVHHGRDDVLPVEAQQPSNQGIHYRCSVIHAMTTVPGILVVSAEHGLSFVPTLRSLSDEETSTMPNFVDLLNMKVDLPQATNAQQSPTEELPLTSPGDDEDEYVSPKDASRQDDDDDDEFDDALSRDDVGDFRDDEMGRQQQFQFETDMSFAESPAKRLHLRADSKGSLNNSQRPPQLQQQTSEESEVTPSPIHPSSEDARRIIKANKSLVKGAVTNAHTFGEGARFIHVQLHRIRAVFARRYMLERNSLEVLTYDGQTIMIKFDVASDAAAAREWLGTHCPCLDDSLEITRQNMKLWQKQWKQGYISNFSYVQFLNVVSGRTLNDLTQYFVCPHVVADFSSPIFPHESSGSIRDLSKPMGALSAERREKAITRYRDLEDMEEVPYHHGTHYSTRAGSLYYLERCQPFTDYLLELNDMKVEVDRSFHSLPMAYQISSSLSNSDVKELIPEFYYSSTHLINHNQIVFGVLQSGGVIDDVDLPPWAKDDPRVVTLVMREALESRAVSSQLHLWIDLIFGSKQRGQGAIQAVNVFHPYTYEGAVESITSDDVIAREAMLTQISNYGQCPQQISSVNHPARSLDAIYRAKSVRLGKRAWCRGPVQHKRLKVFDWPEGLHVNAKARQCVDYEPDSVALLRISKSQPTQVALRPGEVLIQSTAYPKRSSAHYIIAQSPSDNSLNITDVKRSKVVLTSRRLVSANMHTCAVSSSQWKGTATSKVFFGTELGTIEAYEFTTRPQTARSGVVSVAAPALATLSGGVRKISRMRPQLPAATTTTSVSRLRCTLDAATVAATTHEPRRVVSHTTEKSSQFEKSLDMVCVLEGHDTSVKTMVYCARWNELVSLDDEGHAFQWDAHENLFLRELKKEGGCAKYDLCSINEEARGDIVLVGTSDTAVVVELWDFDGSRIACYPSFPFQVSAVLAVGSCVFLGTHDGSIVVLDSFDLSVRTVMRDERLGHTERICALSVDEFHTRLASADVSGTVVQWWFKSA